MRRLRLLHLISNAGSSPYLNAWWDFGDRERFEFCFGSLTATGVMQRDLDQRGASTFALGRAGRAGLLLAAADLARRFRREPVDILQTHLLEAALAGALAARLAGTPLVVFTGHHSHEVSLGGGRRFRLADTLASRGLSHRIIAHSQDMKRIFMEYEGVPAERISVIPYPFDFRPWRFDPEGRARVRQELGLGDAPVFGAVGRLFWVKDYPTMLDAFAEVAAVDPQVLLVIVGDGALRSDLEGHIARLGLGRRVRLAGQRSDMPAVMSAFDVFVHSSRAESFCQALVEAAAMRRPLVSTPVGIAPEIIREGENGTLVPVGDVGALTRGLRQLLARRGDWPRMGEAAWREVQPFAAELIIPRYEAQHLAWLGQLA